MSFINHILKKDGLREISMDGSKLRVILKQNDELCEYCMEVPQIEYFATFNCLFGNKRVLFGDTQQHLNIKISSQEAQNLQSMIESCNPIYCNPEVKAEEQSFLFRKKIWVNEKHFTYVQRKSLIQNKFEVFNMTGSTINADIEQDGEMRELRLNASQLDYFATFKCLFDFKRVLFGAHQQHVNIKLSAQKAQILQSAIESCDPVYSHSDMTAVVKHKYFAERLWVNEAHVSYVQRKSFIHNKFDVSSVAVPDIAFYNITGKAIKRIYFGYIDQIDIQSPNKEFAIKLEEYLKSNGAKLGKEISSIYSSSFRISKFYIPAYWFTKERISFNDEAILYHKKTFFSQDSIYLPFNKITIVFASKGWLKKRLIILGEMHVITKQPFKNNSPLKI